MQKNKTIKWVILFVSITLSLFMIVFFLELTHQKDEHLYYVSSMEEAYYNAIENVNLDKSDFSISSRFFENKKSVALFETQASMLEYSNVSYTFDPHIIQTIVFVVDRSQTDEKITTFLDIIETDLQVSLDFSEMIAPNMWDFSKTHQIVLTMANAIYGEYNVDSLALELKQMKEENRLFIQDCSKPIFVTYDSVAVKLKEENNHLEIIVPEDTLSFMYGAYIYDNAIKFDSSLDEALLNAGYRLDTKEVKSSYYPSEEAYLNAKTVDDFEQFNHSASSVSKTIRRDTFETRIYGFTNAKETALFYLVLMFALIMYFEFLLYRITNRKIRAAVSKVILLQVFFMSVGLLKMLTVSNPYLETFLWYAYYIPLLLVPAIFVYISLQDTNKEMSKRTKYYYRIYVLFTVLLLVFIFTNSIHQLVFIVHNHYTTSFTHNIGYYVVMGWVGLSILFAYARLAFLLIGSAKKKAFVYPILATIFVGVYTCLRNAGFKPVREFDMSFAIVIIVGIYIESCMQSRLFPNNFGYKKLFNHSSLAMKIVDDEKNTVVESNESKQVNEKFVLKTTNIVGGSFVYYEDHTSLNITQAKLKEVIGKIKQNNAYLLQNGVVQTNLATLAAQKRVYDHIDEILKEGTQKMESLILKSTKKNQIQMMHQISVYACLMKRACMFTINSLYQSTRPIMIMLSAMQEVNEYTMHLDLNINILCLYEKDLDTKQMLSMYTFFKDALIKALHSSCMNVVVQVYEKEDRIVFSILTDRPLHLDLSKNENEIKCKPWDDTEIYLLSFRKEVKYD